MALQSTAHAKYDLQYHFVWCPKYRKMVLKENIALFVKKIIYEVAQAIRLQCVGIGCDA